MSSNILYIDKEEIINSIKDIKTDILLLVIDKNVQSEYAEFINTIESLESKKVIKWIAPAGEEVKGFKFLEECLEYFLDKGCHRKAHLIAFGGGAISDFSGVVASLLLRGIDWSIIPSTILSIVDASIGGKTAINSKSGKNLIGTFKEPQNIYINEEFCESLPRDEYESGLGEITKYCFLSSEILRNTKSPITKKREIYKLCSQYKKTIVEHDLMESGQRKILNFGHTFGHALEKIYNLKHGIAVYWGIVFVFLVFDQEDYISELKSITDKLELGDLEVPWINGINIEEIMSYLSKDKKMQMDGKLEFVLLKNIGTPYIESFKIEDIKSKLELKREKIEQFKF